MTENVGEGEVGGDTKSNEFVSGFEGKKYRGFSRVRLVDFQHPFCVTYATCSNL
jgi:hypothetical protein